MKISYVFRISTNLLKKNSYVLLCNNYYQGGSKLLGRYYLKVDKLCAIKKEL